jgi:RsiW-degrading membrane proteinase PrsW (M82 family)
VSISTIVLLVVLGFLPSLVWLGFYIKKDWHPDPKYLISKTFLLGIIMAPLAVIAQWVFRGIALGLKPDYDIQSSVIFFLWAAFIEEAVKFLVVRFVVLHNSEFDEPLDAMIYMISAAMGFAAVENVLILFQAIPNGAEAAIQIWLLRFVGATLLHAVASAVVGYFLALSWFYNHHSGKLITIGLGIATIMHLIFNVILLGSKGKPEGFLYSTIFLMFMAGIVATLFRKLKKREIAASSLA